MRIAGFGLQTTSSFEIKAITDNFKERNADKIADQKEQVNDFIENGKHIPQTHLGFQIEKVINDSCKFLHDGLSKIFSGGESTLAGRSNGEYEKHIDELAEAIQNQDYKRSEKLIDKFFGGSTDKIISKIKNLASAAEDKFWNGLSEAINMLPSGGNEYDLEYNGKQYKNFTGKDIAHLAANLAREEVDPFSDQDFSGLIDKIRKNAVTNAKGKLQHAGRNKYSENAVSITASAAEFSRNKIFNTNDTVIKEDNEDLADIYGLKDGDLLSNEQIDRLRQRNKRKTDNFYEYTRDRSDRFNEIFGALASSAVLVKQVKPEAERTEGAAAQVTATMPNLLAESEQAQIQQQKNLNSTLLPDYDVDEYINKADAIEKYEAQQAKWDEDLTDSGQGE